MLERPADRAELPLLLARARSTGLALDLIDDDADPLGRRRCRTYRLSLQPALWGGVDVVRAWGRRGSLVRPRRLVTHHLDETGASAALAAAIRRRLRHGYQVGRLA